MKKLFSILLLTGLVINSIGFITYYYYNNVKLKSEMKSFFMKNPALDKLELINIEKKQLNNHTVFKRINDKEIKYKGKLYDIYKEIVKADRILFYGINDKNEEGFFSNLSNYYEEHFNPKDIFKDKIRNFSQLFFFGFLDKIQPLLDLNFSKSYLRFSYDFYKSFVTDISSPPPKFN